MMNYRDVIQKNITLHYKDEPAPREYRIVLPTIHPVDAGEISEYVSYPVLLYRLKSSYMSMYMYEFIGVEIR